MDVVNGVIAWGTSHGTLIFGVLWGLCEALAALPFVKSNSVFQLIYNWMKKEEEVQVATPPSVTNTGSNPPPSQL